MSIISINAYGVKNEGGPLSYIVSLDGIPEKNVTGLSDFIAVWEALQNDIMTALKTEKVLRLNISITTVPPEA